MRKGHEDLIQVVANALLSIPAGQPLLLACSGGPDSMFLAHALRILARPFALAHVNYGLRGAEADADEALVRSYAAEWHLPCHVLQAKAPPPGASVQAHARDQRYAFFEALMDQHGYSCCLTAHQCDDQVESLLLSLLRGRQPRLLQGIPAQRDRYLRPLLTLPKAELLAALDALGLPYRHDASNDESYYLRNRIRHEVLPALRTIHPQVEAHLLRRHAWYEQQYRLLQQVLAPYRPDSTQHRLDWTPFVAAHGAALLPVLVAEVLHGWGLSGAELDDTLRLIDSQPGAARDLPQGRLVRTAVGVDLLPSLAASAPLTLTAFTGTQQHRLGARELRLTLPAEPPERFADGGPLYLDASQLHWPLLLRPWQQGDRMQPLGLRGHKKLSDIFVDAGFSPLARQQAVVIADQQGIVALADFRVAERVRLRAATQQVMRVEVSAPVGVGTPPTGPATPAD